MASTITREENGTIKLKIVIPQSEVKKTWEHVLEDFTKEAKVPGFRKGKAPKKLVGERVSEASVREEVLRHLLPKLYMDSVNEHKLKPIMDPRIHVGGELGQEADWEFEALTAEAPEVDLGEYKNQIKMITAKSKIAIPGKEAQEPNFDEIVKALLASSKVKVPQPLIERETDRLLAQTLEEIKKLGLSLDQYLGSTGKTADALRKEYEEKALSDLTLEFVLQKVAETEKITVDDADLEKTIGNAKTSEERANLEANKYLLASIIRQQKTLDFLKSL